MIVGAIYYVGFQQRKPFRAVIPPEEIAAWASERGVARNPGRCLSPLSPLGRGEQEGVARKICRALGAQEKGVVACVGDGPLALGASGQF